MTRFGQGAGGTLAFLFCFIAFSPAQAARPLAPSPPTVELTVSAAASLKDVLLDLGQRYERMHPAVSIHFNFGPTGVLQQQIEQGAPVDLFVSAADAGMDALAVQKRIDVSTRRILAGNELVLIAPRESKTPVHSFRDLALAAVQQVAIGAPQTVPAGRYAQQLLTALKIWRVVLPKAVQCSDVRAVLTQVELGNVTAGIVYRTDAASSQRVRVVAVAPRGLHTPIHYPAAVVADSPHAPEAKLFETFLCGRVGRATFHRYRFTAR